MMPQTSFIRSCRRSALAGTRSYFFHASLVLVGDDSVDADVKRADKVTCEDAEDYAPSSLDFRAAVYDYE
jgi:hypothetical protein